MSETVILQTSNSIRLYRDRLIYDGSTYLISDMKQASIKSGFLKPVSLEIEFKNGDTQLFNVGTVPIPSGINKLLSSSVVNTASQDLKASTQQWATAINTLIALNLGYQ